MANKSRSYIQSISVAMAKHHKPGDMGSLCRKTQGPYAQR